MDDDTLKHRFRLGETGPHLEVSRPTESQLFVLALSRQSADGGERLRLVRRLMRVVEAVVGSSQWDDVIESRMIAGTLDPNDLVDFSQAVLGFDWAALAGAQEAPEPGPLPTEGEPIDWSDLPPDRD